MVKDPGLGDRHSSQSLRMEVTIDGKRARVGRHYRHFSQSTRIKVTIEGKRPRVGRKAL